MKADIIGVPLSLGANKRGVDMGPSAIRYADLELVLGNMGIECRDLGNIEIPASGNIYIKNDTKLKYLDEINKVNQKLYEKVRNSVLDGCMPLVLGGDHSIAVGTILGVQSVFKNIGLIWFDAHPDFNTENTTPSGNLHGMPLAACTGSGASGMTVFKHKEIQFINPKNVVIIGVRDVDDKEEENVLNSGITVFTMEDIDLYGMRDVMTRAVEIATNGTNGLHLSFDMDVINPQEAPGVGTPVEGGLTYREAHLAVEMISDSGKLSSMEFVEVNTLLDNKNQTANLAVSLIASALGKKILNKKH